MDATPLVARPRAQRLDVAPFAALYCGAAALALLSPVAAALAAAAAVLGHIAALLTAYWSPRLRARLCFREAPAAAATHVLARDTASGDTDIVPLARDADTVSCSIRQATFLLDAEDGKLAPLEYPTAHPLRWYASCRGHQTAAQLSAAERRWGLNECALPMPAFGDLFVEHALAPFFVFQVGSVLLWMLDEYWFYSLLTLVMLVVFEATVCQQRLRSMQSLRAMRQRPFEVAVFRNQRWTTAMSNELVPGDVASLTRAMVPCDGVIVRGAAVVNEAMLTGESVPQKKSSVEGGDDAGLSLDNAAHRKSVLFAGTTMLQVSGDGSSSSSVPRAPDRGVVVVVARTGFATAQGQLMRVILSTTGRVSAHSADAFYFIGGLVAVALVASAYVLRAGLADPDRDRFKLFLHCVMIVTSVVPPELPMELTLAVNNSLIALSRLALYCTEPFRIPFAGRVDRACFDKTGTLTSDALVLRGVAAAGSTELLLDGMDPAARSVLATCHDVAVVDGRVVGDPMECALLAATGWVVHSSDVVAAPNGARVRVVHRLAFSSAMQRMSALVQGMGAELTLTCKGAPEALQPLLRAVPEGYEETYTALAAQGFRVLALAFRTVRNRGLPRSELESGLKFAGFAVLACPVKHDTAAVLDTLQRRGGVRSVMITGDSVLTALYVARELRMVSAGSGSGAVLLPDGRGGLCWFEDGEESPFVPGGAVPEGAAVSGDALALLPAGALGVLARDVQVWARMRPQQKEAVVTAMNAQGLVTLMCGDGTNDVGALRRAHVGVSVVNSAPGGSPDELVGNASIASPFTSKGASIAAVAHVVRYGRATLTTTTQMFQVLGLNCLTTAYQLSALHLKGVKLGDTQMTVAGLSTAVFFLLASQSKPLAKLARGNPPASVFHPRVFVSLVLQAALNVATLFMAVLAADPHVAPGELGDPDGDFAPNVMNSVVFLVACTMSVNTFLINCGGNGHKQGIRDTRGFLPALALAWGALVLAATGVFPPINDALELAELPESLRMMVLGLIAQNTFVGMMVELLVTTLSGLV